MRRTRRLGALLLSSAVVVGLPYLLLVRLSWPGPELTWASLLVHLSSLQLPPGLLAAALVVTLWALWGLYTLGLAAEAVARLRGAPRRIRPLGPLQIIAATAIGGTLVSPAQAMADTVTVSLDDETTLEADAERDAAPPAEAAPEADADTGPRQKATERARTVTGFALNSAGLSEDLREDLATTIELIRKHGDPDSTIRITGHTDASGSTEVNLALSEQRARSVADHIAEQLGDAAPEIEVEGVGSEHQREGDAAAQRRVEISYTVRSGPAAGEDRAAEAETPQDEDRAAPPVEAETPRDAEADAGAGGAAETEDSSGSDSRDPEPEPEPEPDLESDLESAALVGAVSEQEEAIAAAAADGASRIVVMEIPDEALLGGAAFAGILGGYLVGRRGGPRLTLQLPRWRALTAGTHAAREEIPEPPRPLPPAEVDDRVLVELTHVPGIGITGSGARGAARRLIANALTPSAEHPARVLITDADAVVLLGTNGKRRLAERQLESVRVVDSMHEALTILQRELHSRADSSVRSDEHDPLILIATPDAEDEAALSGLLLHGQERGITAVLLGRWPLGGSCTIESNGLITETSPPLNGIYHAYWPGLDAARVNELIRRHRGARVDEDAPGDWKRLFDQIAANAPEESPAPATADRTGEPSPAERIATEETPAEQHPAEQHPAEPATTGRTATEQNEGARTERAGAATTEEFDPFYASETAERDSAERPAATEAEVQTETGPAEPANPWLADAPTVSTGSMGSTGGTTGSTTGSRAAANWRESAGTGEDAGTVTEPAAETPRQDEARDEAAAPGTGTEQEGPDQRPVPADSVAAPTEAPADPLAAPAPTGSAKDEPAEPDEPGRSVAAPAEAAQQQPESTIPAADPADRRPAVSQRTGTPASASAGRAVSPRRPAAPPSARRWPKRPLTPAANRGDAPAAAETPATAETRAAADTPATAESGAESAPQNPAPPSSAPAPRKEHRPEPEPVAAAEPASSPTPATEPTPQPQPQPQPESQPQPQP
ncbi:OmpA family protein, partial [Marinitenerispora sediminis]|uniref:OmpA family protein n=1 Tax=Marinitenerispora sediminis TaxID=1931232 RepID=UPI000DF377A8